MKHKSIVLALVACVSLGFGGWLGTGSPAAPEVRVLSEGGSATVLDITLSGVATESRTEAGQAFTALSLPDQPAMTGVVGAPALPQIISNVGLPDNATVSVDVLESDYQVYPGITVFPAQKPLTDNDRPDFTISPVAYAKDEFYPGPLASVAYQTTWRGLPFANIVISPVSYNPVQRELRVYTHLRVRVNHSGTQVRRQIEPWLAGIYQQNIDNFNQLPTDISWNETPGTRLLIITPNTYAGGWLDSLAFWHNKQGIETRIIAQASWTEGAVKDSIYAEYSSHTPHLLRWVLLIGEYNEIPQHAYPSVGGTDMWYADLEPPASPDNYFDIGIGRLSPQSLPDLGNQIQKILKFQRNPPTSPDWFSKVTLAAHNQEYPGKYSECTRGIYNYPYALYHYTFDTIMGGTNGTNAMVSADINEGRVVVNYRGHGSEYEWWQWDHANTSWVASNINALSNGDLTPVVINCCCLNHVLNYASGPCLGESWMSKYPGGAVASLGASMASYTIPNHGWDSLLFRCLGDTYTNSVPGVRNYVCPTYDIGWMGINADAYIQRYYASQGGTDNAQMYYWLGDPATMVWTGMPLTPDVAYQAAVPLGDYDLGLTVTRTGSPVKNALVCLWKSGEFYATGYTDVSGMVSLHINSLTPGEFYVTVTGQGILPYEGTCLARTSGSAYVTYLRSTIDDVAGGNGDGSVNPGEVINLPTWVKNLGDSMAHSLVGEISTADTFVSLYVFNKGFGDINAHDSAWTGTSGYSFGVAPACTNGHIINFLLACHDNSDSVWNSHIYIRVGAPSLAYQGLEVIDPGPGGNGNGRLDPSETADLVVTLHNVGYGNAAGVTAELRSGDSRLVVNDADGSFGTIPAESSGTNASDHFNVTTLVMSPETQLPCTLVVTCGALVQTLPFSIMVGEIRAQDPIPDGPRTPEKYWAYDDGDVLYEEHPTYNWVEVAGLGTHLTLADDETQTISLPPAFGPFRFYGTDFSQVSICGNGWVGMGSTSTSTYTETAIPTAAMPPAFFLHWDDLYPPSGGGIWYYHDAANHRFIVEYDSVPLYAAQTDYQKFELVMYDTTMAAADGNCEATIQYQIADSPGSCTVGEQDPTMAIAIQCLFDGTYHRGSLPLGASRAIKFTTDPPTVGVEEPGAGATRAPRVLAMTASPNPFRSTASVHWQLPSAGRVKLVVYDVSGRAVRTLVNGQCAAGEYTAPWDGRDEAGRIVANGMYLYRLETASGRINVKAVMLR